MSDPDVLTRYQAAGREYADIVSRARRQVEGSFDELDPPTIAYLGELFRVELLDEDDKGRWDAEGRQLYRDVAAQLDRAGVAFHSPWRGLESARWAEQTRAALTEHVPFYRQMRGAGDLDAIVATWMEDALDLLESRGLVVSPDAVEPFRLLCRAMNDAAISAGEDRLKRLEGQEVPTPSEPLAPALPRPPEGAPTVAVPIMATFDDYATNMTAGVRADWRRNIAHLVAFVGHDDARRLTTDDVMRWRDSLGSEMSRNGKPRDPVTIKGKFVGALKAMLNWAVQDRRLATNVASPVTVRVPKKAKLRQPDFTMDEARAILKATLAPVSPRMARGHALARRWVPWLCAYTGGRVNEFSQLRAEDVREIDGIWTVHITPEAGPVKAKEARLVPLHPHLIEQGFLAVVQAQGSGPLFFDPSRQRVAAEGSRHFKKVGERLAQWVREEVGISDRGIKPNHAWRHMFKTRAYAAGMQERVMDAIQGHAATSVGRTYGTIQLDVMAEAIRLLPRFDVPGV